MFWSHLKSVASPVPEIIAIGLLFFWIGVANPQSWGRAVFENRYFSFFSDFKKRDFLRCFEMTLKKT